MGIDHGSGGWDGQRRAKGGNIETTIIEYQKKRFNKKGDLLSTGFQRETCFSRLFPRDQGF